MRFGGLDDFSVFQRAAISAYFSGKPHKKNKNNSKSDKINIFETNYFIIS